MPASLQRVLVHSEQLVARVLMLLDEFESVVQMRQMWVLSHEVCLIPLIPHMRAARMLELREALGPGNGRANERRLALDLAVEVVELGLEVRELALDPLR